MGPPFLKGERFLLFPIGKSFPLLKGERLFLMIVEFEISLKKV